MKPKQKHSIVLSGLAICLLLVYIAFQNFTSSQSGEEKNPLSQSGRVTSIGKQSETTSTSGNYLGDDPFGRGNPVMEEPKKWVFQKPDITWKTRTLSGVTYIFGEGDPKEVAIKPGDPRIQGQPFVQGEIVRIKTERLLADFLANPMLWNVMNTCGPMTRPRDSNDIGLSAGLPDILFTTDFSMEGMISIDQATGLKLLDREKLGLLSIVFSQIRDFEYPNITKERVNFLANQCLSTSEIAGFDKLVDQYSSIGESWSNGSPENRKEVCNFSGIEPCNPIN